MDPMFTSKPPCPGVRFYPSDEELFMYYLKRKVLGKSFPFEMMSDVDVYRFAPWDLPGKSCLKTKDLYWYFFCPRVKKYATSGRAHRLNDFGYWKSTGNDRTVDYRGRPVGKIKTLIFHRGKPPSGERTNWVIHEYKLEDQRLADKGVSQDSYVICKIYEKSGWGPKNGEHYGAPFVEEEWDNDIDDNVQANHPESSVPIADVNPFGDTFAGLPPSTSQLTAACTPSTTTIEPTVPGTPDFNALATPASTTVTCTEQWMESVTAACTPSTTTTAEPTAPVAKQVSPDEPLAANGSAQIVDDDNLYAGLPELDFAGFIELNDICENSGDFNWSLSDIPDDFPGLELNELN